MPPRVRCAERPLSLLLEAPSLKPAFQHQIDETARLVRDPARAVFFRPRLGKTRTVVDAAAQLHAAGEIDALVVVAPAEARSVWADPSPMLGEVSKWWAGTNPPELTEFRLKTKLSALGRDRGRLAVLVANPEFVRRQDHLEPLIGWMQKRRCLLTADESWQFASPGADQTKALWRLAGVATRKVILNGTPGEIKHAYGQYRILGQIFPGIKNRLGFRERYCIMGGYMSKEVVGYRNETEFQAATAPITTYLTRADVFEDLPPARIQIEVPLTVPTWKVYCDMRRDLIAWLSANESAVAAHAGAKVMRLAQITSGIVGGVELSAQGDVLEGPAVSAPIRIIGREKLDGLLGWLDREGVPDKLVVFARFKADVTRTAEALTEAYPTHAVRRMFSDASRTEKDELKRLFVAGGEPEPAIGVINAQSGGAGLSLAQSNLAVFLGHEYSLRLRDQAEQRIADEQQVTYLDVLATGPAGQRTVDHVILAAQRAQQETANWTAGLWKQALLDGETESE